MEITINEKELRKIACFPTVISHQRTKPSDFFRLIAKGWEVLLYLREKAEYPRLRREKKLITTTISQNCGDMGMEVFPCHHNICHILHTPPPPLPLLAHLSGTPVTITTTFHHHHNHHHLLSNPSGISVSTTTTSH